MKLKKINFEKVPIARTKKEIKRINKMTRLICFFAEQRKS
jgi:hypothetical protein